MLTHAAAWATAETCPARLLTPPTHCWSLCEAFPRLPYSVSRLPVPWRLPTFGPFTGQLAPALVSIPLCLLLLKKKISPNRSYHLLKKKEKVSVAPQFSQD